MAKTVAIYHKTDQGVTRIGTFTYQSHWHGSIRDLSEKFFAAHPDITPEERDKYYAANRRKIFGVWVDGDLLQMDS